MRIRRTFDSNTAAGLVSATRRPRWLTRGAIRLGILCLFIVLVDMLSPRLDTHDAGVVVVVGFVLLVGGAVAFVLATRVGATRLGSINPRLGARQRRAGAVLGLLRHTGLPLLGLVFFLVWTLVYVATWWYRPAGAFSGLEAEPRFADFFYYSVSTGLISPPGDIIAASRGARSATLIEMITALALLTAYLSSFTDFIGSAPDADDVN
jgi:hypothetical protein